MKLHGNEKFKIYAVFFVCEINVRNRRDNQEWTIQRKCEHWGTQETRRSQTKQITQKICVGQHYAHDTRRRQKKKTQSNRTPLYANKHK